MHILGYVCTPARTYEFVYISMCAHTHIRIHICIHVDIHTYIHTHTSTGFQFFQHGALGFSCPGLGAYVSQGLGLLYGV